ncbi:V-type ATP synthase subunit I [Magnetococcales bacterium HHB-1]
MSITSLFKVTLCGQNQKRDAVLDGLQEMGCLHLIPLSGSNRAKRESPPARGAVDAYTALHYLLHVQPRRRQVRSKQNFDINQVVKEILHNKIRRREVGDRLEYLRYQLKELALWGEFTLPHPSLIKGQHLWLYQVPHHLKSELNNLEWPWSQVGQDARFAHIVVISPQKPPPEALPVPPLPLRSFHSTKKTEEKAEELEIELEALDWERQALSRWIYLLSQNLAHAENQAALKHARAQIMEQEGVFILRGWIPQREIKQLVTFAKQQGLAIQATHPGPDDNPPTLLENPPAFQGGQDLVRFYETPCYRCWDPSLVVFFSFSVFFAMILADVGYTLLLSGIVALYWKRLGRSDTGVRFRVMSVTILVASLVYGVMAGSYFGLSPPDDHPLSLLQIIDLTNYDSMIKLSIIIGALHVGLANGAVAWQADGFPDNAQPLGWITITVGGLLWWLTMEWANNLLPMVGLSLVIIGGLTVLAFGSQRPVHDLKSGLLRGLDGFIAFTNITKLFGDILSYLRLFALGLASGSLAMTFNQIAQQVQEAMPGLGLFLSLLILILGHTVNLGLGLISGFVHGLRLNFIEFFNWAVREEGVPFQAFAKKEVKL